MRDNRRLSVEDRRTLKSSDFGVCCLWGGTKGVSLVFCSMKSSWLGFGLVFLLDEEFVVGV
jgi:hypothetical protein